MVEIPQEELAKLKGQGFILMKDKEHFTCRVVYPAGIATAEDLANTARLAEEYAQGRVVMTVRLNAEIPGIPYEHIAPMKEAMDRYNLIYGGTGPKVRPIVACKGTVCRFGLVDTQRLCLELHEQFFAMPLHHKFKINISGCHNNCAKAQLNDLAFMGAAGGLLRVFIGGRYGRECIVGDEVCKIPQGRAASLTAACTDFYRTYGKPMQRFGDLLAAMKGTPEHGAFLRRLKAFEE